MKPCGSATGTVASALPSGSTAYRTSSSDATVAGTTLSA